MATIPEALAIALQHHQLGQLEAAEQIYRQILQVDPHHADAIHLLGLVAHQIGKHELAVEYINQAIRLKETEAAFHNNLGEVYRAIRRIPEAIACYGRALELEPGYASAYNNLGNALCAQGKGDEAILCFCRALELKPDFAEAHFNLGNVLKDDGRLDEAVASYSQALKLKPDYARAYNHLGNALQEQRKLDEAIARYCRARELQPDLADAHYNLGNILREKRPHEAVACYRRATELRPNCAEAYINLGNLLYDQGNLEEAVACYRRGLEIRPDCAEAYNNLGFALFDAGKLDEAIASYGQALKLKPKYAEAHNNLGNALKHQGKLDEAIACYYKALELKPGFAMAHSNVLYTLQFCAEQDLEAIQQEYLFWNRKFAEPLSKFIQPHLNDRTPNRRLRIGYVSPDFYIHPVGRFILPLLETHNRQDFEIFCYSSVRVPDKMTDRCLAHADVWRDVRSLDDERLAEAIRDDRIDILVDLTMHMANGRLLVFARNSAPVQVTYLAYCGTTGLRSIDYRLTDPWLDPPGEERDYYSEQSIRLPETYWCYWPMAEAPEVNDLPALPGGPITFGCLNNFAKVTVPSLVTWCRILQAVSNSRLLLHAATGSHRNRALEVLCQHGISPERLIFTELVSIAEYFRLYQRIDVALDPFPYGGGTTTCDALWMGVPVVSLAGLTAVGRGGLSILSNVGLAELVASDAEQYVRIAVELAGDLVRLSQLRATLRTRMQRSPLMDAPRFARNIEGTYRRMWQKWCAE